jgi:hypothetical protein
MLPESVLFVAYEASQIELFIEIARFIRLRTSFVPIVYCPYALPKAEIYAQQCCQAGIEYLQAHTSLGGRINLAEIIEKLAVRYSQPVATIEPGCRGEVAEWAKGSPGYPQWASVARQRKRIGQTRAEVRKVLEKWMSLRSDEVREQAISEFSLWLGTYQLEMEIAHQLVERLRVAVIVLAEHVAERDSGMWLRTAAEHGIPAIVMAQHVAARQGTVGTYACRFEYSMLHPANKVLVEFFPHWRLDYDGYELVRLPAGQALAQEWWGIAMPRPWVVNSEPLNGVWLESEFLAELYRMEGVEGKYISVVGSPHLDRLAQIITGQIYVERSDVWDELEIDLSKPLLLCALPANLYPQRKAWRFESYLELVCHWLEVLRRVKNLSVLVSLHPSAGSELSDWVARRGFPFVRGQLTEILPRASVYIASMSSTIAWALACGVPVINYDVYCLNYRFFRQEHGCLTVQSHLEFEQLLAEIDVYFAGRAKPGESSRIARLEKNARRHAEYYGRLDGLSIERIVAGIWELSRRKVPVPMARNYWQGEIRDCTILRQWLQERLSGIAPRMEEDFWQLRKCEANDWVDEPQLKLAS